MAAGLPTLYDELNRKGLEALEMLIRKREQGKINDSEFTVGVDAVFNCVAGLVNSDVMDVMAECQKEVKAEQVEKRGYYKQGQPLVIVLWLKSRDKVAFRKLDWMSGKPNDTIKDFSQETIPSRAAKDYMARLITGLVDKGFKQVM